MRKTLRASAICILAACILGIWIVIAENATLCPAQAPAPASPLASADATINNREGWAPWTANSIQPPPEIKPAKLPPLTPQPGDGETEIIVRRAIAWFDQAIKDADMLTSPAEAASDGLLAGGKFYACGSPGFIQEYYGRAGGYSFLTAFSGDKISKLAKNDVLLIGQLTPKDECALDHDFVALTSGGGWNCPATVIHIASHSFVRVQRTAPLVFKDHWKGRLTLLDTKAPEGSNWSDVSLGQMSALAMGWAFHGEVFAAASRRGKTLATYGSDCEPYGKDWDKTVEGKNVNDRFKIPPIPAGKITRDYYRICQKQLADFLETRQANQVRLAARRMSRTLKNGKAIFIVVSGHVHNQGAIIPREFLRMTIYGRSWEWRPKIMQPGDMLFWLGYLEYPKKEIADALGRGGDVVSLIVPDCPTTEHETTIRSCWANWDTVINVPDFPVRILPTSGVVQTAQWYALMAEMQKAWQKSE